MSAGGRDGVRGRRSRVDALDQRVRDGRVAAALERHPQQHQVRPLRADLPRGRRVGAQLGQQRPALRAVGRELRLPAVQPLHVRAGAGLVVDRVLELVHDDAPVVGVGDVEVRRQVDRVALGAAALPDRHVVREMARAAGHRCGRHLVDAHAAHRQIAEQRMTLAVGDRDHDRRHGQVARRAIGGGIEHARQQRRRSESGPGGDGHGTGGDRRERPGEPRDPGDGGPVGVGEPCPGGGEVERERRREDLVEQPRDIWGHRRAPRGLCRGAPCRRDRCGRELDPVAGADRGGGHRPGVRRVEQAGHEQPLVVVDRRIDGERLGADRGELGGRDRARGGHALGLRGDRGRDVRADVEAVRGDRARRVAHRVARKRRRRGAIADRVLQREQRVRLGLPADS